MERLLPLARFVSSYIGQLLERILYRCFRHGTIQSGVYRCFLHGTEIITVLGDFKHGFPIIRSERSYSVSFLLAGRDELLAKSKSVVFAIPEVPL